MQSKHIVYKFYHLFRSELNSRHRFHLHVDSEREDLLFSILPPISTSPPVSVTSEASSNFVFGGNSLTILL